MLTTFFLLALGPKLQVAEGNVEYAPKKKILATTRFNKDYKD